MEEEGRQGRAGRAGTGGARSADKTRLPSWRCSRPPLLPLPCPISALPSLPPRPTPHRSQTNAQNAANIAKVQQVAVAGIVLAVLLALVALIVGTVYVSKTKAIDSKYSRIITDWIPGRHDTGMGGVGGPARGGFVNQGF